MSIEILSNTKVMFSGQECTVYPLVPILRDFLLRGRNPLPWFTCRDGAINMRTTSESDTLSFHFETRSGESESITLSKSQCLKVLDRIGGRSLTVETDSDGYPDRGHVRANVEQGDLLSLSRDPEALRVLVVERGGNERDGNLITVSDTFFAKYFNGNDFDHVTEYVCDRLRDPECADMISVSDAKIRERFSDVERLGTSPAWKIHDKVILSINSESVDWNQSRWDGFEFFVGYEEVSKRFLDIDSALQCVESYVCPYRESLASLIRSGKSEFDIEVDGEVWQVSLEKVSGPEA